MQGNTNFNGHFVVFLAANLPINAALCMWITLGQLQGERAIFGAAISAYQVVAIFGLHYALTLPAKLLHRPTKFLFHLMASTSHKAHVKRVTPTRKIELPRIGDLRDLKSLFRLNLLIGALHVPAKRRFGMTYMGLGLITLTSFVKSLMVYGKFLIFSYKIYVYDKK